MEVSLAILNQIAGNPEKITAKEALMKAYRARRELAVAENHEIETPCAVVKQTSRKELLDNRK